MGGFGFITDEPAAHWRLAVWPESAQLPRDGEERVAGPPCPRCGRRTLGHRVQLAASLPELFSPGMLASPRSTSASSRTVLMLELPGWLPSAQTVTIEDRPVRVYRLRKHERRAAEWAATVNVSDIRPKSTRHRRSGPALAAEIPVIVQCGACGQWALVPLPPTFGR